MINNSNRQLSWKIFANRREILLNNLNHVYIAYKNTTHHGLMNIVEEVISTEARNATVFEDGMFKNLLSSHIEALSLKENWEAAYAWGRIFYIIDRRPSHGWLPLLGIAISAGIINSAGLTDPYNKRINTIIPKKIVQFWDDSLPHDVEETIKCWISQETEFEHYLFDKKSAQVFFESNHFESVSKAFNLTPTPAGKSDIFRLGWLASFGGIYIDADEKRISDLSQLIPPSAKIVLNWSAGMPPCINNWFVAAEKNSPFISMLLANAVDGVLDAHDQGIYLGPWLLTGPGLYTMSILDALCCEAHSRFAVEKLFIHTEQIYNNVAHEDMNLSYKSDPNRNWKLAEN